jgi:hypothetical protein
MMIVSAVYASILTSPTVVIGSLASSSLCCRSPILVVPERGYTGT